MGNIYIYIYIYTHILYIYIHTHIQTKPKHIDAENRIKVTEGGVGWGQVVKWEQGVNCMEVDGSQCFGGELTVVYTAVKI